MDLLPYAIGFAVLFFGYLGINKYLSSKRLTDGGHLIRVLLFEQVGQDKVFRQTTKGVEMKDDKLGVYILLKNLKKSISDVSNKDFFYDQKYGKCLIICKYADDDYRVMSSLKGQTWFKKVLVEKPKTDKKGNPLIEQIELSDGSFEETPLMETVEEYQPYKEPLGVDQSAREAMRWNRDFQRRMDERMGEVKGFWERYGQLIMVGGMLIVILMSTAYNANKFETASKNIANAFGEKADEYLEEIKKPTFAETLINKIEQRNKEGEAPPS